MCVITYLRGRGKRTATYNVPKFPKNSRICSWALQACGQQWMEWPSTERNFSSGSKPQNMSCHYGTLPNWSTPTQEGWERGSFKEKSAHQNPCTKNAQHSTREKGWHNAELYSVSTAVGLNTSLCSTPSVTTAHKPRSLLAGKFLPLPTPKQPTPQNPTGTPSCWISSTTAQSAHNLCNIWDII